MIPLRPPYRNRSAFRVPRLEQLRARLPMDAAVDIQVDHELLKRNFEFTHNTHNGTFRTAFAVTNITDQPITELKINEGLSDREISAIEDRTDPPKLLDRGLPAFGQRRPGIDINPSRVIVHPTEPRLIALMNQDHSVAVIHTASQQVEKVVWVGTHPTSGSFSSDYSEFFVATSTANRIAVLSTSTWEVIRAVELDFTPLDIAT